MVGVDLFINLDSGSWWTKEDGLYIRVRDGEGGWGRMRSPTARLFITIKKELKVISKLLKSI